MITIRRMREADVPQVAELWRRARPHDYVDQGTLSAFLKSPQFVPEVVLAAADVNEIVGAAVGNVRGGDEGRIPLLFVSAKYVSSGLADLLLQRVLSAFDMAGMKDVEAGTSWETGLSA